MIRPLTPFGGTVVAAILACGILAVVLTLHGSRRAHVPVTVTGKLHVPAHTSRHPRHRISESWKVRVTDRVDTSVWLHVTPQQYRDARVGQSYHAG